MTDGVDCGGPERFRATRRLDRRVLVRCAAALALLPIFDKAALVGAQVGETDQVTIEWREPRSLGPLHAAAGFEQQVMRAIFGTLVTLSDDLLPTLDLAESVDVSPDFTSYTFTLREGVTFNDDAPLTSADVLFTLERALDRRVGSTWTSRLQGIVGATDYGARKAERVAGLDAPDDRKVRITLAKPDSAFLFTLADRCGLGILPKHVLESVPPENLARHEFTLAPTVGAGPFAFARYERDQFVELERNDAYWGDPPAIDRILLRMLQPELIAEDLERGLLDLAAVSVADAERLSGLDTLTVVAVESPSMDALSLNLEREYLRDTRLRQAMMHAIDRVGIVREIYKGYAVVRNSPIFGPAWMGVPEGLNEYAFDPDIARRLVGESGWDTSRTVELMVDSAGNGTLNEAIPIIQAQLADVGIRTALLPLEAAELNARTSRTDYEIAIGGGGLYGADPSVGALEYRSDAFTPHGANRVHYANPRVDALDSEGRETGDNDVRKVIYAELAALLNDEVPSIFLWSPTTFFAFNNRLRGFLPPRDSDNRLWNAERWSTADE